MRVALATLAVLIAWLGGSPTVAAQPLTQNDYTIDLVQGPVFGSGRIIGLGGAYSALAEGIDGAPFNPASYGSRTLWELGWFDWEITFSLLFPGAFSGDDLYNRGDAEGLLFEDFYWIGYGFRLQFGDVGFGAIPRTQSIRIQNPAGESVDVSFTTSNIGMAVQTLSGQLVLGYGVRLADLSMLSANGAAELVNFNGIGAEAGLLVRLYDEPWRLGLAGRLPVASTAITGTAVEQGPDGVLRAGGFVLPDGVRMPWEAQLGFALQIGNRPMNRRFVDPMESDDALSRQVVAARAERERAQVERELATAGVPPPPPDPYRWLRARARDTGFWEAEHRIRAEEDRELEQQIEEAAEVRDAAARDLTRLYLLISADVIVKGATDDGVGVEGFLAQQRLVSGEDITVSFHLGVEGEPWTDRLKLRAGGYLEPSRFATAGYRVHGTAGFDLRLFTWDLFGLLDEFDLRAGATIDVAERYFDWGISVGFWH